MICRDTKKSKVEVTIPDDDDPPLAGPSFISDDELSQLQEMFPCRPQNCLRDSLLAHGTVNKAALSLAGLEDGEDDSDLYQSPFQEVPPSLQTIIDDLKKHLSDEKEKLKVEEDDILNDALTYYKDRDFDPKKKLRIVFKNQPAADTGGVVRQFFTELLREISEVFFYGDKSKRPIYNSDIVSSGMMKLVGVIIVHSILLAGLGFPVLSRSVYRYLATGKTDEVVQNMTIDDCSARIRCYIQKVIFSSLLLIERVVSMPRCKGWLLI